MGRCMSVAVPAILRQWQILRFIPRYPQKTTAQQVKYYLEKTLLGVETIPVRTIQRDLESLSGQGFMLVCDDRDKPYGWSWHKDAPLFDIPGMSNSEAIVFALAEQYLNHILPQSSLSALSRHFNAARKILGDTNSSANWLNKVSVVPASQPLLPPQISMDVQQTLSDALMLNRQLEITYRKKGNDVPVIYVVHPIAIIQKGYVLYLSARLFDYKDSRILAIHRISNAKLLDDSAKLPDDFDIEEQKSNGVWQFGNGGFLKLCLHFFEGKGEHLHETALSSDQEIECLNNSRTEHVVKATVPDTPQLRWWILGFADGVEVIHPASLRQELTQLTAKMASRYQQPS